MSDEWQDIPENDGITLGPEEALEREIARSKALKVERLRLRDQVDKLTAENLALRGENEALKQGMPNDPATAHPSRKPESRPRKPFLPDRWALFLLLFNLAAIGILLIFMLQNPVP